MVLYHGRVVEAGPPKLVIGDPQHPYTRLLIDSIPWPDLTHDWGISEVIPDSQDNLRKELQSQGTIMRGEIEGFDLSVCQ